MRTRITIVGIALAAGVLEACSASGSGPRSEVGAAYVMGSLDGSMPATPQEIVEATKDVLEDSDIHVLSSGATSVDGTVVGRTDLDRKIEITVKRVDDKESQVSIRVGASGDKGVSQDLFDRIKARVT